MKFFAICSLFMGQIRRVKMTDKEKLMTLLTEFGVEFQEDNDDRNDIVCEEGYAKVWGYWDFYTRFEFNKEGKFIQMGTWE